VNRALLPALVANFRDLGGLRTTAGHTVRPRRLLRSASLAHLSPGGVAALTALLGPAVYADLRTDEEVDRDGAPDALVAAGWHWLRIPVRDKPPGRPDGDQDPPARYRAAMPRYLTAADEVATAATGAVAGEMADVRRPVVLGCSLGKDRTGLVAALLLARLGVAAADIGADFELSNPNLAAQRHLLPARWRDPAARIAVVSAGPCLAALAGLGPAAARGAGWLRAELVTTDGAVRCEDRTGTGGR
jgi:protein-tyrosine phosphatase